MGLGVAGVGEAVALGVGLGVVGGVERGITCRGEGVGLGVVGMGETVA